MKHPTLGWLASAVLLLAACATPVKDDPQAPGAPEGLRDSLARHEQAMRERPWDSELRIQYFRAREQLIAQGLARAGSAAAAGQFEAALADYRQVLAIDPANSRAAGGLAAIETARRHQMLAEDARGRLAKGDLASAELMTKAVLTENPAHPLAREVERELRERERSRAIAVPVLKSRLQAPVNLEFRDAPLRQVIEALSRSAGINFILDRDVRPDLKSTVFVKGVRVEDAIDLILLNNQLERKVLTENTILIYPATPAKLREHQELVMRSIQLGNADAKQVLNMLRTMVKTKEMFVDERTNTLVMRDTPDAVRAAERLIAAQDVADPEVMLEIEILEASRAKVRDLGLTFPSEFSGPAGTLDQIRNLSSATISADTGFKLKLLRTDGETRTLANPRVRVRNKEKARVHIGDRVPVISSTIVGTSVSGSSPVTTEQIQYLDVGIKVEAEATVHPDDTVAVKINLDVSSLGTQTKTNAGTVAYEVGTRNASTVLRLKDGETQALMGLIRDDDVNTGVGLPFLGEVPLLDRIFGTKKTDRRSRELVLLITPRLVRGYRPPESTLAEFWSGTEGALRLRSPFVQTIADATPAAAALPSALPAAPGTSAAPAGAATATTVTAAAPVPIAPPAPLALSWKLPPQLPAGQESRIELHARTEGELRGASVQLRYDPEQIEVLGVEEGALFGQAGKTVFTPRIDAGIGIVSATLGAVDAPAKGGGTLLALRIKPRGATAKARLVLSSALGIDPASRRVPLTGGDAVELVFRP